MDYAVIADRDFDIFVFKHNSVFGDFEFGFSGMLLLDCLFLFFYRESCISERRYFYEKFYVTVIDQPRDRIPFRTGDLVMMISFDRESDDLISRPAERVERQIGTF